MTEQLQFPFNLPPVHCHQCHEVVPQPFWVAKHFGRTTEQFAFCNEKHANDFYLERLRQSGL